MSGDAWSNYRREPNRQTEDWQQPPNRDNRNGDNRNGFSGGYGSGGYGRSDRYSDRKVDSRGNRLMEVNWNNQELQPVVKDFSCEHPNLMARSEEDCELIRVRHGIRVEVENGLNNFAIPKPFENLEETSFPDWVSLTMRSKSWKDPTPIQIQTWPVALKGHDVIGIAATGSGKTMAYVVPMLVHIIAQPTVKPGEGPVGLVLVPTRELSVQVAQEIATFAPNTNLRCESVCGGEDAEAQGNKFIERIDVVTATPGRLIKLLERQQTNLKRTTYLVLDEADDLLDERGQESSFSRQVRDITKQVRPDRQLLLFSATWSDNVDTFSQSLSDRRSVTVRIHVGGMKLAACKDIDQLLWSRKYTNSKWLNGQAKSQVVVNALSQDIVKADLDSLRWKAIVFVNRGADIGMLVTAIKDAGFAVEGFSGESTQVVRAEQLKRFKEQGSEIQVMVATDVLSRGHDFMNVKYVINYDMPARLEVYVHRIGRTGRMGQKGMSLTLMEDVDFRFAPSLCDLMKETNQSVPKWLVQEIPHNKKWNREYRDHVHRIRAAAEDAEESAWRGRGKSRREDFLEELGGTGLARRIDLAPNAGMAIPAA